MFSLALVSQSQALPLLFLPLAMAAGHPDAGLKRVHATMHRAAVPVAPMLYPTNIISCSVNADSSRRLGEAYVIVLDSRFGLSSPRF